MIKEQHKHSGKERGSNWGVANVETSQITFLRNSSSRFQRECHNWKFTKKVRELWHIITNKTQSDAVKSYSLAWCFDWLNQSGQEEEKKGLPWNLHDWYRQNSHTCLCMSRAGGHACTHSSKEKAQRHVEVMEVLCHCGQ